MQRVLRAAAMIAALFQLSWGFYFDWSDRFIHFGLGMVLAGIALRAPRVSLSLSLGVLLVGIVSSRLSASSLGKGVSPGQSWSSAKAVLGSATLEARNLSQATTELDGYAEPSPWRYPGDVPVAVYVQGDAALWVFHDEQHVLARFEGGS